MRSQAVQFSPRWKAMLGYADSELAAQFSTWLTLLHPEDHPRAKAALNAYLRGDAEHYQIEWALPRWPVQMDFEPGHGGQPQRGWPALAHDWHPQ